MRLLKQNSEGSLYFSLGDFIITQGRKKITCKNGINALYFFYQLTNIK